MEVAGTVWFDGALIALGGYRLAPSAGPLPVFVTAWLSRDKGDSWQVAAEYAMPATDSQVWRGPAAVIPLGTDFPVVGAADVPTEPHTDYAWTTYAHAPAGWIVRSSE